MISQQLDIIVIRVIQTANNYRHQAVFVALVESLLLNFKQPSWMKGGYLKNS